MTGSHFGHTYIDRKISTGEPRTPDPRLRTKIPGLRSKKSQQLNKEQLNLKINTYFFMSGPNLTKLSPFLFWDINQEDLQWPIHQEFIVQRILEYGVLSDFLELKNAVGLQKIGQISKGLRNLDRVSMHFVATITNSKLNEFRCYTSKPLTTNSIDF